MRLMQADERRLCMCGQRRIYLEHFTRAVVRTFLLLSLSTKAIYNYLKNF